MLLNSPVCNNSDVHTTSHKQRCKNEETDLFCLRDLLLSLPTCFRTPRMSGSRLAQCLPKKFALHALHQKQNRLIAKLKAVHGHIAIFLRYRNPIVTTWIVWAWAGCPPSVAGFFSFDRCDQFHCHNAHALSVPMMS